MKLKLISLLFLIINIGESFAMNHTISGKTVTGDLISCLDFETTPKLDETVVVRLPNGQLVWGQIKKIVDRGIKIVNADQTIIQTNEYLIAHSKTESKHFTSELFKFIDSK